MLLILYDYRYRRRCRLRRHTLIADDDLHGMPPLRRHDVTLAMMPPQYHMPAPRYMPRAMIRR